MFESHEIDVYIINVKKYRFTMIYCNYCIWLSYVHSYLIIFHPRSKVGKDCNEEQTEHASLPERKSLLRHLHNFEAYARQTANKYGWNIIDICFTIFAWVHAGTSPMIFSMRKNGALIVGALCKTYEYKNIIKQYQNMQKQTVESGTWTTVIRLLEINLVQGRYKT